MKYILYPNCKIIFGHRRAIIYDIYRLRYKILPLELANIIIVNQKKNVEKLGFSKKNLEIFTGFIKTLHKDDYVFLYNNEKQNLFTDIRLDFETPENISTVVIKLSKLHLNNFKRLISILENSNVKNLHLICEIPLTNEILKLISDETKKSQIEYIEISYSEKIGIDSAFVSILNMNSRISNIYVPNVFYKLNVKKPKWCAIVLYKSNAFLNSMHKKKSLRVNKSVFCESQNFNTFFNKKIFINESGHIVKTLCLLFIFFSLKFSSQTINSESYKNFAIADSLFSKNNYSAAISYYEKASKLNVNHNAIFYKLAICYRKCGFSEKAFRSIVSATNNGMYFIDTASVRKDTNIAGCLKIKPKQISETIYKDIIYNSLHNSPNYVDTTLFFSESRRLLYLKKIDQEFRNGNAVGDSLWKIQKENDKLNEKELKVILKKMNWPGIAQVGFESSVAAFLIAQHSENLEFQKFCLKRMNKELKYKNISMSHYAYLYDRILLQQCGKQLFGTQVDYVLINNKETAVAKPLQNKDMVNVFRFYFQLPTLEDYLKVMNKETK
jgi:hypothetical protein